MAEMWETVPFPNCGSFWGNIIHMCFLHTSPSSGLTSSMRLLYG